MIGYLKYFLSIYLIVSKLYSGQLNFGKIGSNRYDKNHILIFITDINMPWVF